MRLSRRVLLRLILSVGIGVSIGSANPVVAAPLTTVSDQLRQHLQDVKLDAEEPGLLHIAGELLYDATSVRQFYQKRGYQPAWSDKSGVLPLANALIQALYMVADEGLDPQQYHLLRLDTFLRQLRQSSTPVSAADAELLATVDLLLSDAFLAVATHLVSGRFPAIRSATAPPTPQSLIDLVDLLQQAVTAGQVTTALHRLMPSQVTYRRLRQALAEYRRLAAQGGWPAIPRGKVLKLGSRDDRVALLRRRLQVTGDLKPVLVDSSREERMSLTVTKLLAIDDGVKSLPVDQVAGAVPSTIVNTVLDVQVERGVRAFQRRHGLLDDGVVGPRTLAALNVSVSERIRQLIVNMERQRQSAQDYGDRYLWVNIPAYTLNVVEGGEPVMTMRVVVGKPKRRTPAFRSMMTYLVLNPYWVIPRRISREEVIPRAKQDLDYLAANHMEIVDGWGATERIIDAKEIDWAAVSTEKFPYRLRQRPGKLNALGRVKFAFPNPFGIYMHDTQARSLFAKPKRAYSHGCVRLEQPIELANRLLRETAWSSERVQNVLERGKQSYVNLKRPIDVYIVYQTVWVEDDGSVQFRPDIYRYDWVQQQAICQLSKQMCA